MFPLSAQKIRTVFPNWKRKMAHFPIRLSIINQAHLLTYTLASNPGWINERRSLSESQMAGPLEKWRMGRRGILEPGIFSQIPAEGCICCSFSTPSTGASVPLPTPSPAFPPSAHPWEGGHACVRTHVTRPTHCCLVFSQLPLVKEASWKHYSPLTQIFKNILEQNSAKNSETIY